FSRAPQGPELPVFHTNRFVSSASVSIGNPSEVAARWTAERRFASPIPPTSANGIFMADPAGSVFNSRRMPSTRSWCLPRLPFLIPATSTRRYFKPDGALLLGPSLIALHLLYMIRSCFLYDSYTYIIPVFYCQALFAMRLLSAPPLAAAINELRILTFL